MASVRVPGSFRDPSGFVFRRDGVLYRQVNRVYADTFDRISESGLFDTLSAAGVLVRHQEVGIDHALTDDAYKVILPDEVPFVSYPYEWTFSQLKRAALLTLEVQLVALEAGFSLKDASAFNVQFVGARPVFIDTLSLERYPEGQPWVAYRQFCRHFIAPLALMSMTDIRLSSLLRTNIDGIPLDLASRLLPLRSRLSFGILSHIHWHAASQKRHESSSKRPQGRAISKFQLEAIVQSLKSTVESLVWKPSKSTWGDYYENTNYSDDSMGQKRSLVHRWIGEVSPATVWDLGANDGTFSRLASSDGIPTVSMDFDPVAVERNYRRCVEKEEACLHPLIVDLTNPSPALGWASSERDSLIDRGPADLVLALALVHHLAISHNVPLEGLARFFADVADSLIIEFVPKSDSQVKRMLATREDVFSAYSRENFEMAFAANFHLKDSVAVVGTERTLYLMKSK